MRPSPGGELEPTFSFAQAVRFAARFGKPPLNEYGLDCSSWELRCGQVRRVEKGGGGKVAINPEQVAFVRSATGRVHRCLCQRPAGRGRGLVRRDRQAPVDDRAARPRRRSPRNAFGNSRRVERLNRFVTAGTYRPCQLAGSMWSRVKRLSFRLSQAVAGGAPPRRPRIARGRARALLRKRAAAYRAGLKTRSSAPRPDRWSLPSIAIPRARPSSIRTNLNIDSGFSLRPVAARPQNSRTGARGRGGESAGLHRIGRGANRLSRRGQRRRRSCCCTG